MSKKKTEDLVTVKFIQPTQFIEVGYVGQYPREHADQLIEKKKAIELKVASPANTSTTKKVEKGSTDNDKR